MVHGYRNPLKLHALALAALLAGLTAVRGASANGPGPILRSTPNSDVVINEVFYTGFAAFLDWVELKNTGASTIDISSWWLCSRFSYAQIGTLTLLDGTDFVMVPGEIITVQSWTNLDNTAADLGLYSSASFTDPAAMVDFVQWGTPSGFIGNAPVAVAAGLWSTTGPGVYDFVQSAAPGFSVAYDGDNSGGGLLTLSLDFINGLPTRGRENFEPVPVGQISWGALKDAYGDRRR